MSNIVTARNREIASKIVSSRSDPKFQRTGRVAELARKLPFVAVIVEDLSDFTQKWERSAFQNNNIRLLRPASLLECIERAAAVNGLLLLKVPAANTSKFDSGRFAPGIRVNYIPWILLKRSGYQRLKKRAENQTEYASVYMTKLFVKAKSMSDEELKDFGSMAFPAPGGKFFCVI